MRNDRGVFGKRISRLREERKWTQGDLAIRTGLSLRTIGTYEREGPPVRRLNLLDAVFDGALLAGTSIETIPLEGMTAQSVAATNGASVPDRGFFDERLDRAVAAVENDLAAMAAADEALAADAAADQGCVTSGLEPLGLVFDEVFGRLRRVEQAIAALAKAQADAGQVGR